MLIVCPNCASAYEVQPDKLGSAGRSVRCARCRTTWFATPSSEQPTAGDMLATAAAPETHAAAPEQIEGGEFGWTPSPEKGADDAAPLSGEHEAVATPGQELAVIPPQPDPADAELGNPPDHAGDLTVSDSPALAPALDHEASPPSHDEGTAPDNIESLAALRAKRAAKRKRQSPRPGLPMLIIGLVVALVCLIAGRMQVVRFAPQTASLYGAIGLPVNLRGLAFENVKTTREVADGVTVLVVEGAIVNVASKTVEVPRIRFGVRNGSGFEIYAWTSVPGRTVVPPGEAVAFRSRLASPPAEARDVVVRFFNRRDVVADSR
jgi:predicted Zn finger-like uncharacterized protein